ncbi:hypothetical protein Tco_0512048 [Tanacetum coccineum]
MFNGRQNHNQRNFARGNGAAGFGGMQNRAGNANASQGKPIKCYNYNGIGHIARNYTQPKHPQNSDYLDECDAFVQMLMIETAQTIFMANLSSGALALTLERFINEVINQSTVIDSTSVLME